VFFQFSRKRFIGKIEPIKIVTTLIFFFLLRDIYCQTNFNDSFITPYWPRNISGDTAKFIRGNAILKSNSTDLSKHNFGIQFPTNHSNAFELEATINCDINLSSANFIDFGFSDSFQKSTFIRLGNTLDQLQIFLQDSQQLSGLEKEFNVSKLSLNFKITISNNTLKIVQVNLIDKTKKIYTIQLNPSQLNCKNGFIQITQYGSSAIGKHSFQNIYFGQIRTDTIPPKIRSIKQIKNNTIEISFSEPIRNIKNDDITCKQILIDSFSVNYDSTIVNCILQNKEHLSSDTLKIQIKQLTDLNGNNAYNEIGVCRYVYIDTPKFGDIILTEIMVKPSPTLGLLPEKKYIEIYNSTNQYFNANCLILTDQNTPCYLPNYIIKPKEYLAIGYKGDTTDFKFTHFLGVNSFPSFNQDNDYVILKTKKNHILFQMYYHENLMDIDHRNGGYSLEKIDIEFGTQESENWVSNKQIGGSPGKPKVKDEVYVPQNLKIIEAYHTLDSVYIRVNCTLNPNSKFAANYNGYKVQLGLINNEILAGNLPLQLNGKTKLKINKLVEFDTMIFKNDSLNISYQYSYDFNKLDFNEILFHNFAGNPDYIEFVNNDTSAIFLEQFVLNIYQDDATSIKYQFPLKNPNRWLLYPQEYICFTSEKSQTLMQFPYSNKHKIIEKSGFPNFTSQSGELGIIHLNSGSTDLTKFHYNDKMHSAFYDETTGISLEKLNENLQSSEINSWSSATQTEHYGTPGKENSVKVQLSQSPNKNHFSIRKNTIIGNETLILDYAFNKPGYIIKADIYNKNGIFLMNSVQNFRSSSQGFINIIPYYQFQILPPENYILKLEAFLPNADLCKQVIRFTVLNK
jgi:hypothetical protein